MIYVMQVNDKRRIEFVIFSILSPGLG